MAYIVTAEYPAPLTTPYVAGYTVHRTNKQLFAEGNVDIFEYSLSLKRIIIIVLV